jgi:integrase
MSVWRKQINHWTDWMRAARRPDTTVRLRSYQMVRFGEDHPRPWAVETEDMINWLISHQWSTESQRSYRAALRSFYAWAYATGRNDHDPAGLLPPIRPDHHEARPTPEEVLATALRCSTPRVQLMLLLAARQGMRRGEIAQARTEDLRQDLFGWSLLVHGKGNKERTIPAHADIAARIRECPDGYLFPGNDRGHLSAPYVGKLMSLALGERGNGWTAHTLRHRFATVAYAGARDLYAVQRLLGHSKPETTINYVRLPDDALRSALAHAA